MEPRSTTDAVQLAEAEARGLAEAVTKAVAESVPWLGPAIEAALFCPVHERQPLRVVTPWGDDAGILLPRSNPDAAKHKQYADHMLGVISELFPWLVTLLNSSRASLLVSPGFCRYTVASIPERPVVAYEIPVLVPMTYLTPFPAESAGMYH